MEKTNIRYLDTGSVVEELDFISIDVSFISLSLVFPVASKLLKSGGLLVSLVKSQFEAGKEQVEKGGLFFHRHAPYRRLRADERGQIGRAHV